MQLVKCEYWFLILQKASMKYWFWIGHNQKDAKTRSQLSSCMWLYTHVCVEKRSRAGALTSYQPADNPTFHEFSTISYIYGSLALKSPPILRGNHAWENRSNYSKSEKRLGFSALFGKNIRTKCLHYDSCLICLMSQLFQSKNLACLPSLRATTVESLVWETNSKISSEKIYQGAAAR